MQEKLAELGFLTSEFDGFYGEATKESVMAFQRANGLEATGEVDPITHAAIYYEKAVRADGTIAEPSAEPSAEPTDAEAVISDEAADADPEERTEAAE
jgi:peptidoglycan hydrolase-like protein with peptidoglycan-binding domain